MKDNIIKNLLDALNDIRNNSAYWFPLAKLNREVAVVAFNIHKIYADDQIDLLEAIMKKLLQRVN